MGGGLLAGDRDVTIVPAMGDSVDDSRCADAGQAEAGDECGLAEPVETDQPVREPEPPRDDYVPV